MSGARRECSVAGGTRSQAMRVPNPHLLLLSPPLLDRPISDQESGSKIVWREHCHYSRAGQEVRRKTRIPDSLRLQAESRENEQEHSGEDPTSNETERRTQDSIDPLELCKLHEPCR